MRIFFLKLLLDFWWEEEEEEEEEEDFRLGRARSRMCSKSLSLYARVCVY